MGERCVVLFSDYNFIHKALNNIYELRTIGKYTDTIVLVTDNNTIDKINNDEKFYASIRNYSITIKVFDNIDLTHILDKINQKPFTDSIDHRELTKTFQWHKIHIFDVYFKQWKYIFYLDVGMHIYNPIEPFWEIIKTYSDCLIAHSDTYPLFKNNYKNQFNKDSYPEVYKELENLVDLDTDNFQSGILLFSSNLIQENTKNDLIYYSNKFHISKTNEQGIMNMYFNGINKIWKPLPVFWNGTYTYDYCARNGLQNSDYIMTKYLPSNFSHLVRPDGV